MEKIGILLGGGGGPGFDALLRSVVRTAAARRAAAAGCRDGFGGLLEGDLVPLDPAAWEDGATAVSGGAALGSSPCPRLRKPGEGERAAARLAEAGVTGLVVAGGEGAAAGAVVLSHAGVRVAFVPVTIHDDVRATDACVGVDTWLNEAIRRIAEERAASGGALAAEVPGMFAGHLALAAAVGAGAAGAVLVERPFPWDRLVEKARGAAVPPLVVCAEGAGSGRDAGSRLAAAWPDPPPRVLPPSAIPRNGPPSFFDRVLGARLGEAATEALLGEKGGVMIAFRGGLCIPVPLDGVAGRRRQVPPEAFEMARRAGVLFE